ncbi:Serine/threonine-protein kinase Nek8 [Trichoplax sp. H2]|nr:Serine/threonine-protein kinase Nek8 [Trichoplax sp. H2]|eukprot:RDD38533.1 Serine/threonine-protein kinase Nek8 [Trichoplax sp. H2]
MDSYEKIRIVGRGAYGTVYLCRRLVDNGLVIIKQIPVEDMTIEERQSAINEVKVLSVLKYPNIIGYYDSFYEDKALMIVMEYAEGGTIFEYLQQRRDELLSEEEILHLFVQILQSLHHVHSKNILHRDLKTQNILLNDRRTVAKLGDFGISKVLNSKSKANTVVGTPCYISPELCEGKPYNHKSDIWSLGCVLYELASLKRAFEAPNLPALVMKIMRGKFAPISSIYSEDLRGLILSMLHLDPSRRPELDEIMALPIIVNSLMQARTSIGRIPCLQLSKKNSSTTRRSKGKRYHASAKSNHTLDSGIDGGSVTNNRATYDRSNSTDDASGILSSSGGSISLPFDSQSLKSSHNSNITSYSHRTNRPGSSISSLSGALTDSEDSHVSSSSAPVFTWGSSSSKPLMLNLPQRSLQITRVDVSRTQKMGVTNCGQIVIWEQNRVQLDGKNDRNINIDIPRLLEGQSVVNITHVSCGDLFTACLTDRGILMTFGSGANGCLGHGNFNEAAHPKIVESLIGYEIVNVSCGASHIMAITAEHELFAWGRGDNGRLGTSNTKTYSVPELIKLPETYQPSSVCCGIDCSMVLCCDGCLLVCGSNRANKLSLDTSDTGLVDEKHSLTRVPSMPLSSLSIEQVAAGTSHTAVITGCSNSLIER